MRHGIKQRKLGRDTAHRKALLSNLASALITHEQISTTLPKAKALKPYVEKLITLGKKGDLASRRKAISLLQDKEVVTKLFSTIADRYKERNGGYSRVMRFGFRAGDSAPVGVIELVDRDLEAKGKADIERVKAERKELAAAEA